MSIWSFLSLFLEKVGFLRSYNFPSSFLIQLQHLVSTAFGFSTVVDHKGGSHNDN